MKRTLLFSILIGLAQLSSAQFNVVATSIANGQTNVPLQDTLWITFNKAVNTDTTLGGIPPAGFLRFYFAPMETNVLPIPIRSGDATKVGIPYKFAPGRFYQFFLQQALSKSGEPLAAPISLRFSTGAAISQGSVSGKVTFVDGSPAPGHTVIIYPEWSHTLRSMEEPAQGVVATGVTDENGNYSIGFLPDGVFYVRAVRVNAPRQPNYGHPDFHIGYFDPNGDRFPDQIVLGRTSRALQNIGVTVRAPAPVFAPTSSSRDSALAIAGRRILGGKLVSVSGIGRMDSLGRAPGWLYLFRNDQTRRDVAVLMSGNEPVYGMEYRSSGEPFTPVPQNWANSDRLAVSLKNALLQAGIPRIAEVMVSLNALHATATNQPNSTTQPVSVKWIASVMYTNAAGGVRNQIFAFDAVTGALFVPAKISARAAVDSVNRMLSMLAAPTSPELVSVTGQVDSSGKADLWTIMLYNYAGKAWTFANVDGTGKVRMDSRPDPSPYAPPKLRGTWLDSPAILDSSRVWQEALSKNAQMQAFVSLKTILIPFPADTVTIWTIQPRYNPGVPSIQPVFAIDNLVASTGKPYAPARFLAFDGSENAINLAKTWKNDAVLNRIGAHGLNNVDQAGAAPMWQYVFSSPSRTDSVLNLWVAGGSTKSDFFVRRVHNRDSSVIPFLPSLSGLINSDRAVSIAETESGADFRAGNPSENVMASLDQVRVKKDSILSIWSVSYPFFTANNAGHYRVLINAANGEIIREKARTTERAPFETAIKAAQEWSRDAQFRYAKADSISADGLVEVWVFGFWSPSKLQALFVEVSGGTTVTNQWVSTTLPKNFAKGQSITSWLESALAIARADSAVGSLLNQQGAVQQVIAELTNGSNGNPKFGENATTAVRGDYWSFSFIKADGHVTEVNVGETGPVTTDAERSSTGIPTSMLLEQNYPNPFNPATSIRYALPEASKVSLDVYNVLGQRVATLVNGVQPAGTYQISFDASKLSSGVYFYRLSAGGQTKVRRMTLLK